MIQEAYCEFMALRNDDMWYGKESVFQMPADSEVRVQKEKPTADIPTVKRNWQNF